MTTRAPAASLDAPEEPGGLPTYVLDDQVGFVLRQVQQRHAVIFSAAFGEEMTTLQWAAVARLTEIGECSQNQLGRLVATDVATIKGVVERLSRRGWVVTRADAADRRRLLLRLSATGQAAYHHHVGAALAVTDATFGPLDETERAQLLALLNRLR